jgi:hypothetical protein
VEAKFVRSAKYTNGDFAAIGSEQFLNIFWLRHHGCERMLVRNFTFSHERAAMPQEFFQCGRQTKFIDGGRPA